MSKISIQKLVFFCLITTIIVTTFSVSKYRTTITGTDSAKVAAFVVDVSSLNSQSNNLYIDCNNSSSLATSYQFLVTNEKDGKVCDVSMKYSIIVTLPETLPESVTLTLNGHRGELSSSGLKYTFSDMGTFVAGVKGNSREHTFTLNFELGKVDITTFQKDISINSIKISINAEQID